MLMISGFDEPKIRVVTLDQFEPEKFRHYIPSTIVIPLRQDFKITTVDLVNVLNRLRYDGNYEFDGITWMTTRCLAVLAENNWCDIALVAYEEGELPCCYNLTKAENPYWSLRYLYWKYIPDDTSPLTVPIHIHKPSDWNKFYIWLFAIEKNNAEAEIRKYDWDKVWFTLPKTTIDEHIKQEAASPDMLGIRLLKKQPCTVNNDGSASIYDVLY